ncbi:MAG: hypothetical protein ABJE95_26975 [Byssovorax sp.]
MKTTRLAPAAAHALLALLGGALVGCAPDFDHLEMKIDTTPPLAVAISSTDVALPVGIAVGVTATPFDTNGEKMDTDVVLDMTPQNQEVIGVQASLDDRSFVFFGVGAGTTSITVEVDHLRRLTIPVTVKLQPAD